MSRASLAESRARPCYNELAMQKFFKKANLTLLAPAKGVLVAGAMLLCGCGLTPEKLETMRPGTLPKKAPPLKPGELPKITVIPGGNLSYWHQAKLGAEAAGKKFGARILWKVPTGGDLAKSQKELVDEAMKTSQGLVIAPSDSTKAIRPVGNAARAGLAVVTFDRDVFTNQNKLSFIHNDDEKSRALKATKNVQPDYYQMGFQSVQTILDFRATKQMPPREIKIAPRVLTDKPIAKGSTL